MTNATRNTRSNATNETKIARKNANASRAKIDATPATIALKTVHNDIMKANPNATIDTKKMRVWLRANMRDVHAHNDAWVFNATTYNIVRSHFDAKYAASLTRKPRAKKIVVDAIEPVANANVDA